MQAKSKALDVLRTHWDKALPVDPIVLAGKLGIRTHSLATLASDGLICRDGADYALYYRPQGTSREHRFTLAHMLGHCCMEHVTGENIRDVKDNFDVQCEDEVERTASIFAVCLLLPEEALRFFVFSQGYTDIDQLCSKFDVSSTVMSVGLREHGIF